MGRVVGQDMGRGCILHEGRGRYLTDELHGGIFGIC
jgi:hypothetical protein